MCRVTWAVAAASSPQRVPPAKLTPRASAAEPPVRLEPGSARRLGEKSLFNTQSKPQNVPPQTMEHAWAGIRGTPNLVGLEGHLRPETLNLTAWNHALGLSYLFFLLGATYLAPGTLFPSLRFVVSERGSLLSLSLLSL